MTPSRVKTVYVVEDDEGVRALLERVLGTFYALRTFETGREALNALQALPPDVLLTDLQIGDYSGEDLAWAAGNLDTPPRVVVMSGDRRRLLQATRWAQATVPKPFAIPALIGAIESESPTTC
jgi:DNA-binding NtrC family response regulator